MVDDKKTREYTSLGAAIILHLILIILLPGITAELISNKEKTPPIELKTNFVELVYPVVPKEVKVIKKEVKNVVISKEKGVKIKTENKKQVTIVKSKVKLEENFLPKVKINREKIEYKSTEKNIFTPKGKVTTISDIDTGAYRSENISLKDVHGSGNLESENQVKSVKLKERVESGDGKEVSTEKGVSNGTGISKIDSPRGVSLEVLDGKGEAFWGKYVEPEYPEKAKIIEKSGRVGILITVDKSGIVRKVKIEEKSGNYEIDESAKKQPDNGKFLL